MIIVTEKISAHFKFEYHFSDEDLKLKQVLSFEQSAEDEVWKVEHMNIQEPPDYILAMAKAEQAQRELNSSKNYLVTIKD